MGFSFAPKKSSTKVLTQEIGSEKQEKVLERTIGGKDRIGPGIALALSFLAVSAFLYYFPQYVANEILTRVLSILFASAGIAGLGIELDKLGGKERKLGFGNLGIGLMIGGIWAAGYYYLNIWWVNLLLLIVLLLALYGIFLGFVQVIIILASSSSVKVSVAKLAIAVIQIAAFIAAVLQIMQILKLI